ncbi:hypothetical protein Aduo_015867 [Ancylostoma duodenale]
MSLCDYMRRLGRASPGCVEPSATATTEGSRLAKMIAILEEKETKSGGRTNQYILCATQEYRDCRDDKESCLSGYSCRSPISRERCCVSSTARVMLSRTPTKCPPKEEMGYTCTFGSKRIPTSWCTAKADCTGSPVQLCCDTGCGFKACLSSTSHVLDTGIRFIQNDRCPPTSLLGIRCRMNSLRATNWCNSDYECQVKSVI